MLHVTSLVVQGSFLSEDKSHDQHITSSFAGGFLHIFICIIFRSDGKVEEIEFIICSIYFEFLNAKINIKHRNKFVFSVTRQCLQHSGQATYLSSANLLAS